MPAPCIIGIAHSQSDADNGPGACAHGAAVCRCSGDRSFCLKAHAHGVGLPGTAGQPSPSGTNVFFLGPAGALQAGAWDILAVRTGPGRRQI